MWRCCVIGVTGCSGQHYLYPALSARLQPKRGYPQLREKERMTHANDTGLRCNASAICCHAFCAMRLLSQLSYSVLLLLVFLCVYTVGAMMVV